MRHTDLFVEWINQQLMQAQSGTRLPSTEEIRRVWGISAATVSRLLKRFVDEGRIVRIRRKGSFIGTAGKLHDRRPDVPPTSAERLAAGIHRLLIEGTLKPGAHIPSVKYLAVQHRVAPRTVIHAYRILCNRGLAEKVGKSFRLAPAPGSMAGQKGARVLLVSRDDAAPGALLRQAGWGTALLAIEEELRLRGYTVEACPLTRFHETYRTWDRLQGASRICGLVCWGLSAGEAGALGPSLAEIGRARTLPTVVDADPQAVLGLSGAVMVLAHSRVYMFGARLLLPHLTIARRGDAAVVSLFPSEEQRAGYFHGVMRAEGQAMQATRIDLWRASDGSAGRPRRAAERPTERAERLGRQWSGAFDELYRDNPSRLWVFPTEESAAAAVFWARSRGIKLPTALAIVAMSSSATAAELGITAVDTNWPHIGYLLAHHIIGDFAVPRTDRGFLRYGGRFIRRDTF